MLKEPSYYYTTVLKETRGDRANCEITSIRSIIDMRSDRKDID